MFTFEGGLERLPLQFQHTVRQHCSPRLLYTCSLSYENPRWKIAYNIINLCWVDLKAKTQVCGAHLIS